MLTLFTGKFEDLLPPQKAGIYWTHTFAEYRAAFTSVGFEILTAQ